MLISAVLFTGTPLQQLLKLPVLVQHYFEHKQTNSALSFAGFLKLHYFEEEEDEDDTDYGRDSQLPFKSMALIVSPALLNVPAVTRYELTAKPEVNTYQSYSPVSKILIPSQYLSSIWQPPKMG